MQMKKYISSARFYSRFLIAVLAIGLVISSATPAAADPVPLSVYGRLPAFESATISPSGEHVAILGTVEGERQILVLDAAGKLVAKMPVGPVKLRGVDWAGDEALLLAFSKTVTLGTEFTASRTELSSVMVIPLGAGKPWTVFGNQPSITGGVWGRYGLVERDGHWFGYYSGITLDRTPNAGEYSLRTGRLMPDLYEVDLTTQRTRKIASRSPNEEFDRHWLINAAGTVDATLEFNRVTGAWQILDAQRHRLAAGSSPSGDIRLIGFTPDGASVVYALRDAKAQRDDWFAVPLAGGEPKPYLADATFQRSFHDAGHRLLGYVDDLADNKPHFFNPLHEKIYLASAKAFPGQRMQLIDMSASFKRLIVTTEGGGDSIAWWLVDIATGSAKPLGTSYPLPPSEVGPFRMVSYKAADGLAMEGVLTLPPGRPEKRLPAIVLPHGGPTAHDAPGFDWIAQAFASRGYAVFQPNFRGSSGYGADFELAGNGEWGRKMQSDISDGLAELVRQGIVDPERVCIVGASYGGYAALAGVTLQQGIYRCAVSIAGISDLARMVNMDISESGSDPLLKRALHEEVGKGRDLYAISPIRFVDRIKVPVMLIHGKDDTVVNPLQSSSMATALRRAGKPVEFVTLPGEDHWLSSSDTRQKMLEAAVGFVTKNNPP